MKMTKRKRDVFTVIESINNWFEASKHYTNPTPDLEGFSGNSDCTTNPGTSTKIDCQTAKSCTPVSDTEHGDEAGHEPPNFPPNHAGLEVRSELAREAASWATDGPRLATRTKKVA